MDVICESCGSKNRSAGEFCTECGAFLGWEGNAGTADPAAARTTAPDQQLGDHPVRSQPQVIGPQASAESGSGPIRSDDAQATTAVLAPVPEGPACPTCWKINEPGRRFCAKCGTQLVGTQPMQTGNPPSPAELRRRERANERAFRDSLPAIYRWRRIGLIALAVALVVGLAITVGANPVGWAKARWYDVKGTLVPVQGVQATVLPQTGGSPGTSGASSDPALLVDGTAADWHIHWTAGERAATCDGGSGTPTIELTLAQPIRIRAIDVYAGLSAQEPQRALQFRPQTIGITPVGAGACKVVPLADSAEPQRLRFDTRQPVSVIRISIDSAYPGPADAQQRLSIREIQLFSRPQ